MAQPTPKLINDPVHGFVAVPHGLIFDLVEHPLVQRLKRIKQLGLSYYVYPGAQHTRFGHALGALHLMQQALNVLKAKGFAITDEECLAAQAAIVLHDIGHGPFSHALEFNIVQGVTHEVLGHCLMRNLDKHFGGALQEAISIFEGKHPKRFLCDLVSSQLDMDRLDYLVRDSYFTGVAEGQVAHTRLIQMLNVSYQDRLVVEQKGIYSVENFLLARRLMYWQVYLHKAVLSADEQLAQLLRRARELCQHERHGLFGTPALLYFLTYPTDPEEMACSAPLLGRFSELEDADLLSAIKIWQQHPDKLLSQLSAGFVHRRLGRLVLRDDAIPPQEVEALRQKLVREEGMTHDETTYFIRTGTVENRAYSPGEGRIGMLQRTGAVVDVADASDLFDADTLFAGTRKHYVWAPKSIWDGAPMPTSPELGF